MQIQEIQSIFKEIATVDEELRRLQEIQSIFKEIATVDEELRRLQECAEKLKDTDSAVRVTVALPCLKKHSSEAQQVHDHFSNLLIGGFFGMPKHAVKPEEST